MIRRGYRLNLYAAWLRRSRFQEHFRFVTGFLQGCDFHGMAAGTFLSQGDDQNRFFLEIDFGQWLGRFFADGMLFPNFGPLRFVRDDDLRRFLESAESALGERPYFLWLAR